MQQSGQSARVIATECGTSTSKLVTTVTTMTGGKFSYATQPLKQTAYAVKIKTSTSSAVTVNVQPRLQLRRLSKHHFSVRVSGRPELRRQGRPSSSALPEGHQTLGQGQARAAQGQHNRSCADRGHVGQVWLEDQEAAEGADRARAEAVGACNRAERSNTIRS